MKSYLVFIGLLIVASTSSVFASEIQISCDSKFKKVQLHGTDSGTTPIQGRLLEEYNGAPLICQRNGWSFLKDHGHPLKCVGVWDISFGKADEWVQQVVEVTLDKDSEGEFFASFKENSDLRSNETPEVVLPCKVSVSDWY